MNQQDILFEIELERSRQDKKWGPNQSHPDVISNSATLIESPEFWRKLNGSRWKILREVGWDGILLEEVAEAIESALNGDIKNLKEELVQCGAVIVAWLEDIDSRTTL